MIELSLNWGRATLNIWEEKVLSLKTVHFRVSREHLSRKFLDECGILLKDYIRIVKIEKGKENLLRDRDLSIKEIATSVGINDDKHFCRLFKEETGLTPGEYRKSA